MIRLGTKSVSLSDVIPIDQLEWRRRAVVRGHVRSMRVQSWSDVPTLELSMVDDTGGILLVFSGRSTIPGLALSSRLVVEGMVIDVRGKMAMMNPAYHLEA
jgi:hypothetical protein